jgi:hypothetical protein
LVARVRGEIGGIQPGSIFVSTAFLMGQIPNIIKGVFKPLPSDRIPAIEVLLTEVQLI